MKAGIALLEEAVEAWKTMHGIHESAEMRIRTVPVRAIVVMKSKSWGWHRRQVYKMSRMAAPATTLEHEATNTKIREDSLVPILSETTTKLRA